MTRKKKSLDGIKSRRRVKDFGEVFTPEHIVKDMCALIPDEMYDLEHTFLEPSCGNGNFLVHILNRKLEKAHNPMDALKALNCLYGVDILPDNVRECRDRLLKICMGVNGWDIGCTLRAYNILESHIVCDNFLTSERFGAQ